MAELYRPIPFKELSSVDRERIYGGSRLTLLQRADGEPGRDYLCRRRQLDVGTIAKFRLGYVPYGVNHPFAGRVVMPIFDAYARMLALSVRPIWDRQCGGCFKFLLNFQLGTNKECPHCKSLETRKLEPKYWNEMFPKRQHLHGLWLAKYEVVRTGTAIIVEGQMDVMTLHAHGFTNTVACLGGAFSMFHALLLKRWARQVVFLFDADKAGGKHSEKAEKATEQMHQMGKWAKGMDGIKVAMMALPNGSDPDTFIRTNGAKAFRGVLNDTMTENGMTRIEHE